MRVQFVPEIAKVSLHNPENVILVENSDNGVLIRAVWDNLSDRKKAAVIRYLAAEGFISDEFENFPKSLSHNSSSIVWAVDENWAKHNYALRQRADRFMIGLFIAASISGVALMVFALVRSAG